MVAQHDLAGITKISDETQYSEGMWATVDEITDEPKSIGLGGEVNLLNQQLERTNTTLHIADCVGSHKRWSVAAIDQWPIMEQKT